MSDKPKRFLLFTYAAYYPCGGWSDFDDSFDSLEQAMACVAQTKPEHYDIVDLETGKVW